MNAHLAGGLLNPQCEAVAVVVQNARHRGGERCRGVFRQPAQQRLALGFVQIAQKRAFRWFAKGQLKEEALERVLKVGLLVGRLGEHQRQGILQQLFVANADAPNDVEGIEGLGRGNAHLGVAQRLHEAQQCHLHGRKLA